MEPPLIQALSELTVGELRDRLIQSDARNYVLSEKLTACESQMDALRMFKEHHDKVWGALTVDEVVLLSRAERGLLEQNPEGFLVQINDALFGRTAVEKVKTECRGVTESALERVRLAEGETAKTRDELDQAREALSQQRQQTQAHIERVKSTEARLAAMHKKWTDCNEGWRRTSEENDALRLRVRVLTEANEAIQTKLAAVSSKSDALRADPEWATLAADYEARLAAMEAEFNARHRAEIDCVAASLYERIKTLKRSR